MRRFISKALLFSSAVLLLSQCTKDDADDEVAEGVQIGEVKLSDAELAAVPYLLNDIVEFKDEFGSSLIFEIELKEKRFYNVHKEGAPDPSTDFYAIEHLEVWLKGNEEENNILIDYSAPLPKYCSNSDFSRNHILLNVDFREVEFSNFYGCYLDPSDFYYSLEGTSIPYHETITLLNQTYDSVYEMETSTNNSSVAYYNRTKGIVGFKTEDGKIWGLEE